MAVIGITSLSASPGVSTSALAWALLSPRPTLVVEADVTGGSPLLAMGWHGAQEHTRSILALVGQDPAVLPEALWEHALALPGRVDRWLLPAISHPMQGPSLGSLWAPLADALHQVSDQTGIDIVIDAGRTTRAGERAWSLLSRADVVLLMTDSTIPALATTAVALPELREALTHTGAPQRLAVVPKIARKASTGTPRPYGRKEIATITGEVPVLPGVLHHESAALSPTRRRSRGYAASITALIAAARDHHERVAALIAGRVPA